MTANPSPIATDATLLIVDDDETIRTLLAESLENGGYRTLTARNAREMDAHLASCERTKITASAAPRRFA